MSSDVIPFAWSGNSDRAAELVAEDRLLDSDIAREVGVTQRTIARWKRKPAFAARVAEAREETRRTLRAEGIALKQNRIDFANERHARLQQVIAFRAQRYAAKLDTDPAVVAAQEARNVFGGETPLEAATGMMVERETVNNAGHRSVEWAVDTGLLREMREHEKQVAQEKGEWTERREDTVNASDSFLAALREFGRGVGA